MAAPDLPTQAPTTSPLLALPAELRNAIYTYILVLVPPSTASTAANTAAAAGPKAHGPSHLSPPNVTQPRLHADLLRTCRQIHAEATPILYGGNVFSAHASLLAGLPALLVPPAAASTPSGSGPVPRALWNRLAPVVHSRPAALIRRFHLRVRLDTDPGFCAAGAEASFGGAAELELDVSQAMFGGCGFGVLALFEGVRGVGRAAVRGSVGDGRYAAWLEESMMQPAGAVVKPFRGVEGKWDTWTHGNR